MIRLQFTLNTIEFEQCINFLYISIKKYNSTCNTIILDQYHKKTFSRRYILF